jgi:hypothetical protein
VPRHTLYAYVDGSDLHDIAMQLESRLDKFVADTRWTWGRESWPLSRLHGALSRARHQRQVPKTEPTMPPSSWFSGTLSLVTRDWFLHRCSQRVFHPSRPEGDASCRAVSAWATAASGCVLSEFRLYEGQI